MNATFEMQIGFDHSHQLTWRVIGSHIPKKNDHYIVGDGGMILRATEDHCDEFPFGGVRLIVQEVKPTRIVFEELFNDTIEVGDYYTYTNTVSMRGIIFACDREPQERGTKRAWKLVEGDFS